MMAAAASAIGVVLGQEIEISVPDIRVLDNPDAAAEMYGSSPHATSTTFLIGGESCRLIQLVPRAFVVRMARALDELEGETVDDDSSSGNTAAGAAQSTALVEALTGINLRVWAELGRTEIGLSRALGLPLGSVVELDRPADAPVDLYVNGLRFAQGHLIVTDDGEWAFQCDTVGGKAVPDRSSREAPTTDVLAEADEAAEAVEPAEETTDEPEDVMAAETPAATPDAVAAETPADTPDAVAAETPADTPDAVAAETSAETAETPDAASADTSADNPAAPSTPNEEGAVD
jgi:flagellar motor switch/type III secretory pathway protein FliN